MRKILRQILTSRVYEAAVETPLEHSPVLSSLYGNRILLKREDQQPIFSFKIRGAYNRIAHLSPEERSCGVLAASAGNHAQGVAFSASKLGIDALIVMPATTPAIKVGAVEGYGARVVLHGTSYSEAAEYAQQLVEETGMVFIHPFDDELVIAGQGTVADEVLRQSPGHIDAIFIPVGGGGLIGGMAAYIKALRPEIRVIGVEPRGSDAMARSLAAGRRISLDSVSIFADGVAVREVGKKTFELCREHVDEIILVDTDELCGGIKAVYQGTRSIVEPAGGLGVAGMLKYIRETGCLNLTLIAVNSGANMNFDRLRYVAERTRVGEKREALFAVTIPEEPGSLKRFCHDLVGERAITEFNYRLADRSAAQIFVGISIRNSAERETFAQELREAGYDNVDLTDNELAKTHIRYMVGGRSREVNNEKLFRLWFPETPGALARFLDATRGKRNISLFHYRMQGGDFGRVLIGFECPENDNEILYRRLDELGYRYIEETDNPAYRLFL